MTSPAAWLDRDVSQGADSRWRNRTLEPVLVFTTLVAAIISSLGAPLIPRVGVALNIPLSTAQWSLTVALLVGAVSAPIMGRLGDGPHRRATLVTALALVAVGGLIAALAHGIGVLVVGRALQGLGLGLTPVTMAAARDHLARERVPGAIALLSVCAAAGIGVGYPLSGIVADLFGLSAAFTFGALVSLAALVCVLLVVPSSQGRAPVPLDLIGSALLAAGLSALLLAIAQGHAWGWHSLPELALFAGAFAALAAWIRWQLRTPSPLVDLRQLRHPWVATGDLCALLLGTCMYLYLSAITAFVQAPRSSGYGFGVGVVTAGLCLLPFSILSILASRCIPTLTRWVGRNGLLPFGSVLVAGAGVSFALWHAHLWQAFMMTAVLGVGAGTTFAAIPGLIIESVPDGETGSATGFYQVVRYIGFSLGSAAAATILAGSTPPGQHLPTLPGFIDVMWCAVAISLTTSALAWLTPQRTRR